MRKIKFRGKECITEDWVYGSYVSQYYSSKLRQQIDAIFVNDEGRTLRHPVVTSTVGQCTGFKDKNGVDIYEEDIVKFDTWNPKQIVYGLNHFAGFTLDKTDAFLLDYDTERMEVIGNIHENPELLVENLKCGFCGKKYEECTCDTEEEDKEDKRICGLCGKSYEKCDCATEKQRYRR